MNRPQEALLFLLREARASKPVSGLSDASPIRSISDISAEEWPLVVAEAHRHGLSPYLYFKFHSRPRPDEHAPESVIPESALAELRQAYLRNAMVNLQRFHYLEAALLALAAAGVPVIVLKGGYLAEAIYGNIALRVMSDLDILVKPADVSKSDSALRRAGFAPAENRVEALADTNEFHFYHRKSGELVELHVEPVDADYPFYMKTEDLWAAAVPARIAGVEAMSLSPEDLLIYQGIHAALHSYGYGLRAFFDAAAIVDRLPVDWHVLIDRTRKFRAEKPVWMLLSLTRDLLGLLFPNEVLSTLRPPDATQAHLESAAKAVLKEDEGGPRRDGGNPKVILFFGRKGLLTKFSLVFHKAFPSWRKVAGLYDLSPYSPLVALHYPHCLWTRIKRFAPAIRAEVAARRKDAESASRKDVASLMDWMMRSG